MGWSGVGAGLSVVIATWTTVIAALSAGMASFAALFSATLCTGFAVVVRPHVAFSTVAIGTVWTLTTFAALSAFSTDWAVALAWRSVLGV